jgi:hypothetical protein
VGSRLDGLEIDDMDDGNIELLGTEVFNFVGTREGTEVVIDGSCDII